MEVRIPVRHYCRYPYETPRGLVETEERLDLAHTVFLVVDVYGKGYDPGDPVPTFPTLFLKEMHLMQAEMMQKRIRPAIDAARAAGLPVVYVENRWQRGVWGNSVYADLLERTEAGHFGKFDEVYVGSDYNAYSDVVAPAKDDIVIAKAMYDGFFETNLDSVLRNMKARNLVCVGFTADICLLNTCLGAMYRNYKVVVLRDATLASEFVDTMDEMSMTKWAIRYYETLVGFTALTDDFIRASSALKTERRDPVPAFA